MKKGPEFLFLVVFAVCVAFFACTEKTPEEEIDSSSSSGVGSYSSSFGTSDYSSNSVENSSDSQNSEMSSCSGGEVANNGSSSSQDQNSTVSSSSFLSSPTSPSSSSSSLRASSSSSHAPLITDPGANCAYQPSWCGGITFDKVKTANMNETDVGATDKGQERPNCIYAKTITQIGNESGGIFINGVQFANGSASRCGGGQYGDATACATKFASVTKADDGYYIYVPAWAGQDFKTTGGQPVCSSTPVTPTKSSSSRASSSSAAINGSTGTCVEPMYGIPPSGVKSCIKKNGKCYTCNPDRGKECESAWIWQANSIDDYWYKEVSCSENNSGTPTYNLTCTGLAQTGVTGTAITQPTVKCNADNATATFASAPNWSNPVAGTFNVSATANCGGNKTVSCGTIVVSAAPSASSTTLTCTGLATTGVAGTAITQPTVKCGTTTVSSPTFTGAPTWNNPTANTYTVSANATGTCTQSASCGTIKVSPKLSCGNPSPATVTAGTAVTAPTVQCGNNNVTSGLSWSGAPTYWSSPETGTYNNIKVTVSSGDCNGQTATCGTLTVGSKLACNSVTQAITTGQTPTKPTVSCGTTTVTSGITWSPTSINSAINTAQTISNVTATATCNGSSQTANCAGTITVTAPQQTPSSSSGNTGGGGSYTPKPAGNQSGQTTQYWDACKPSCSWGGKSGLQANSCDISGKNIGHNDGDRSACDGGNAFTCMNQAPWKVGNISYGYVAVNDGSCGDCYQLDFPNGEVMVVMKSNIGSINGKFDIMIPGGGVGDFDALTRQVKNSGVNNPDMGARYGGFRLACNNSVSCVRDKCNSVFANLPDLKAGCLWYVNTLGGSPSSFDNPSVKYQKVDCPAELKSRF